MVCTANVRTSVAAASKAEVFACAAREQVVVICPPAFTVAFACEIGKVPPLFGIFDVVEFKHHVDIARPGRCLTGFDAGQSAWSDAEVIGDVFEPEHPCFAEPS